MNPIFNSPCKDELYAFMEARKASSAPGTYKNDLVYMMSFDHFLSLSGFCGGYIPEETVNGWVSSLPPDICIATRKAYIVALRKFLAFRRGLGKNSYIPPCPKTADGYVPYIYTDEEIRKICSAADDWPPSAGRRGLPYIHVELPMLMRLLASSGLRLGETLALKVKDVDTINGILTMRHTKKGKERLVPVHESLRQALAQYCMALGIAGNPEAYIFPRRSFEEPLRDYEIGNRFRHTVLEKAGILPEGRKKNERGPCIHSIRHYFVLKSFKQMEKKGYRTDDAVPYLSIYLGHDSILETQKYMKFTAEMFPEEMGLFEDYTAGVFPEVDYG